MRCAMIVGTLLIAITITQKNSLARQKCADLVRRLSAAFDLPLHRQRKQSR